MTVTPDGTKVEAKLRDRLMTKGELAAAAGVNLNTISRVCASRPVTIGTYRRVLAELDRRPSRRPFLAHAS